MFWFFMWILTTLACLIVISVLAGFSIKRTEDIREIQKWAAAWRRSSIIWQERALIAELDATVFVAPSEDEIHVPNANDER